MRLAPSRLLRATFVERPNRFLIRCRIEGRGLIEAMMPNPGRLSELLLPEAVLYVSEDFSGERGKSTRKTRFTVWAVEREGKPIFLHTHRTNAVARYLIENRRIPAFASSRIVQAEIRCGRSRFDFLLEEAGQEYYLEVKSVTLFGNGAALFPDAVTARGRRHLLELARLGEEAIPEKRPKPAVLFLIHSNHPDRFLPDYHTDLEFSRTFLEVRDRVRLHPVSVSWNASLELEEEVRELPIPWDFLRREAQDRGAYLLALRIDQTNRFSVKRLGEVGFPPGWYLYVGSAMKNLTSRTARHLRRRKRFHWHIDYLRDRAVEVIALPIRSSSREECAIADGLSRIFPAHCPGFGASDCSCPTHLYFTSTNPLGQIRFHRLLESFRMPKP